MSVDILLSLDSLIVSMALVMLDVLPGRQRRLCAAFMLSDGIATFLGLSIHTPFAGAWVAEFVSPIVCAYLLLVIVIAARARSLASRGTNLVLWAPILLGLDNLLAAIAGKPSHAGGVWPASVMAALMSGLLALGGIAMANAVMRGMPRRWAYGAGVLLLIAAILIS